MLHKYFDGSEKFLLDFFNKPQSQKLEEIDTLLNSNPAWNLLYHISPQREFLLEWYPFKQDGLLLEVGAGCGALTGLFCRKLKKVYANELTNQRRRIIQKRFVDKSNLTLIPGNITEVNLQDEFDYVTLIGVLEYAGKYIVVKNGDTLTPFIDLLKKVKKFLNKDGHLLLAIENRIGLKYLAGGREDHDGVLFSSIENYPNYQGIRTFTKGELIILLKKAGFAGMDFYYPYPDYKLPQVVFSEAGLNSKLNITKSSFSKIIDYSHERIPLFNEIIYADSLDNEGLSSYFSNSFLVDAKL